MWELYRFCPLEQLFSEMEAAWHPFAGLVVNEECKARQRPGDRVDDGDRQV